MLLLFAVSCHNRHFIRARSSEREFCTTRCPSRPSEPLERYWCKGAALRSGMQLGSDSRPCERNTLRFVHKFKFMADAALVFSAHLGGASVPAATTSDGSKDLSAFGGDGLRTAYFHVATGTCKRFAWPPWNSWAVPIFAGFEACFVAHPPIAVHRLFMKISFMLISLGRCAACFGTPDLPTFVCCTVA